MSVTIKSTWCATAPEFPNSATKTREAFARSAVFAEFGRHAWAIDEIDFVDRQPNEAPRRVDGQLARKVA